MLGRRADMFTTNRDVSAKTLSVRPTELQVPTQLIPNTQLQVHTQLHRNFQLQAHT
jgi:hypothetical protein